MADIILTLDAGEAAAVDAALTEYRGLLLRADARGGVAAEMAQTMGPLAERVTRRLHEQMFGLDEPQEPEWVGGEPEPSEQFIVATAWAIGDYPPDVSYHDWQRAL